MTQPAPVPTPPPGDPAPVPTPPPTPAPAPPADPAPPSDDIPKGDKRTILADLAKERDRRQALEKRFEALATALGNGDPAKGKSDVELLNERFAEHEKALADERAARWRVEVAQAKGLTADQAAWISGSTAEELAASADKLLASFPASGPRNPAPDPSQGARGGQPGPDIAAQVAEATAKGDWRKAAALEKTKLANVKR